MTDEYRAKPSRRIAGAIRLAALAAVFAIAACAQVKETASEASDQIDQWLGTGSDEASDADPGAERRFQDGLEARARGADAEAFASFLAAAESGHGPAAYEIGLAYRDGRGAAVDLEASAQWINRAADRGEPRAQHLIGLAYYSGTGVARDDAHAIRFLTPAAERGHADAQLLLGRAFANGRGVTKNRTWAARWYGKAAAQGLREAQYRYGVVRASGLGPPKDNQRGYTWLLLAVRAGHPKAGEVAAALEKKLTPAQLAQATARADKFAPATDPPFADPPTVMYLQQALAGLGFDAGPVDGILGTRSRTAISSYRNTRGLPASGELDPELLQRLLAEQTAGA